jgi:hypothetical protein
MVLKLIGMLVVFTLAGKRAEAQFMSYDHLLEPEEISLHRRLACWRLRRVHAASPRHGRGRPGCAAKLRH